MDIKRLVKKEVSTLKAYQAKEIPCSIKLDANESPYGFQEALKAVSNIKTNRYPDPAAKELKAIIAKELRIRPQQMLQGNGSDELIYYLIATFGGPVLYPTPTFSMYGIIAQALGEKKVEVPLDSGFDLDISAMLSAIKKQRPKLIFLSSPNNPTGNCYSSEKILRVIEASSNIVVVDEAYQPFSSKKGFQPLLKDYKNLVIMRTLSKIGLAALRFGFMIAEEEIIEEVNKVRLPFNVNSLSQAVAVEALKNSKRLNDVIKKIALERKRLISGLDKIDGVAPFRTEANFIMFSVKDPDLIYNKLLNQGILVRNIKDVVPGCLRVTVGTEQENTIFLKMLSKVMKDLNK